MDAGLWRFPPLEGMQLQTHDIFLVQKLCILDQEDEDMDPDKEQKERKGEEEHVQTCSE